LASLCEEDAAVAWGSYGSTREAFEAIVNRHMKDAYFIALGLVGNQEDALELSQEAFYRAYKHFDQLNAPEKFFPWFYQILRNLCFSHLRKRKVRRDYALGASDTSDVDTAASGTAAMLAGQDAAAASMPETFDPEVVAERNESKDRLWKAIGQLDEKHREVIILRHFRNMSYDEMAKILFCNRGTVTSRLYYARKRLKELLDRESGCPAADGSDREPRKGGQK